MSKPEQLNGIRFDCKMELFERWKQVYLLEYTGVEVQTADKAIVTG